MNKLRDCLTDEDVKLAWLICQINMSPFDRLSTFQNHFQGIRKIAFLYRFRIVFEACC